jgi:hypothetical protein
VFFEKKSKNPLNFWSPYKKISNPSKKFLTAPLLLSKWQGVETMKYPKYHKNNHKDILVLNA